VFPIHAEGTDVGPFLPLERDLIRAATAAAPHARVLDPDHERLILARSRGAGEPESHRKPAELLEGCFQGAMAAESCAERLHADVTLRTVVRASAGAFLGAIHLRRASRGADTKILILEGKSPDELRLSFKAQAADFLAALTQREEVRAVEAAGAGHSLRIAPHDPAKLDECDDLLLKAILRREVMLATAVGDRPGAMEELVSEAADDVSAANRLESCAKSFGPVFHYVSAVHAGAAVTRAAVASSPVVTPEQCADVRARLGELHDEAKNAAMTGAPDPAALMSSGMRIGVYTDMRDICR
jgi:hypothetical protein